MLSRFADIENKVRRQLEDNLIEWTKSKLARLTGGEVPVAVSSSPERSIRAAVATPSFDLYEDRREFRLVVDVPGATPSNTHVTWDDFDTLLVHVQRGVTKGSPQPPCTDAELDWYREIIISPEADGSKARATVREGILTVQIPKRRTISSKLIPVLAGADAYA